MTKSTISAWQYAKIISHIYEYIERLDHDYVDDICTMCNNSRPIYILENNEDCPYYESINENRVSITSNNHDYGSSSWYYIEFVESEL